MTQLDPNKITRRQFVHQTSALMALGAAAVSVSPSFGKAVSAPSPIRVTKVDSNFEREPLTPYRFKGSEVTTGWQVAAYLEST